MLYLTYWEYLKVLQNKPGALVIEKVMEPHFVSMLPLGSAPGKVARK